MVCGDPTLARGNEKGAALAVFEIEEATGTQGSGGRLGLVVHC